MPIWTWIYERAFCASIALVYAFLITLVWLFVGGGLSLAFHHSGYALAFGLLGLGGNCIVLFVTGGQLQNAVLYFAVLLCLIGIAYVVTLAVISIRAYLLVRKAEREKIARATCYTLPARENAFVRERLNTVLREESDEGEPLTLSFAYVRRMLSGLKNVSLPLPETLEVEELNKLFALYIKKETFTITDVNVLNEAFARLLKLSAKHGVIAR